MVAIDYWCMHSDCCMVSLICEFRVAISLTFAIFVLQFSADTDLTPSIYLSAQLAGGGLMLGAFFHGDGLCDQT